MNDAFLIGGMIDETSSFRIEKLPIGILLSNCSNRRYIRNDFLIVFLVEVNNGKQNKLVGKQLSDLLPLHRISLQFKSKFYYHKLFYHSSTVAALDSKI